MHDWILGIDGGGTTSRLRVESIDGDLLYQGSDGSTNLNSNDVPTVTGVLERLLSGALDKGLPPEACRAGFIGSAGVDLEEDRTTMAVALGEAFKNVAGSRFPATAPVFAAGNDAEPALVGALADIEGYLLIAGTGSIALGRAEDGSSVRSGGWGHFLGDEGSAFWIAFEAIKRGIRSSEGRDVPTGLLESALRHFDLSEASGFIPYTYWNFDKARFASFAPLVAAAAESGDALAMAIMDGAAAELAALAVSVHDRMEARIRRKRLALYGGLLEKNRWLRAAVSDRIRAALPGITIVEAAGDAQTGACRLARESLGQN